LIEACFTTDFETHDRPDLSWVGRRYSGIRSDLIGVDVSPELLGIHTNMACAIPPEIDPTAFTGATPPPNLSAEERQAFDQVAFFYKYGLGYTQEMGNRPQTLYSVVDCSVGLAAWMSY
jgi:hypothetical protein